MPVDYPRATEAYKVGAERGDNMCQFQVGTMYYNGRGVDVDYKQAVPWMEKAAAGEYPTAISQLGVMYSQGLGVAPSWRRAREYHEKAAALGNPQAASFLKEMTDAIQQVTSQRSNHSAPESLVCDLVLPSTRPDAHLSPPAPGACTQTLMDKRVEIHGTSRADMNGKCGVATDYHVMGGLDDITKHRYTVKLDDGVAFKVKPTSVRAEGSGGQIASVSGGGGVVPTKAKGKTKGKAKGKSKAKSKGKAKQERAEFDML